MIAEIPCNIAEIPGELPHDRNVMGKGIQTVSFPMTFNSVQDENPSTGQ
jgi:hypothetical protein